MQGNSLSVRDGEPSSSDSDSGNSERSYSDHVSTFSKATSISNPPQPQVLRPVIVAQGNSYAQTDLATGLTAYRNIALTTAYEPSPASQRETLERRYPKNEPEDSPAAAALAPDPSSLDNDGMRDFVQTNNVASFTLNSSTTNRAGLEFGTGLLSTLDATASVMLGGVSGLVLGSVREAMRMEERLYNHEAGVTEWISGISHSSGVM